MRTEGEIEAGIIPGVEQIVLGGVAYPAREPVNERAWTIRMALADFDRVVADTGDDRRAFMELVKKTMDTCLRNFSEEIEADWDRILKTATDSERVAAHKVVRESVNLIFLTLAGTATPAPNRKARRQKT